MSALWSMGMFFDMKIPLEHEDYVEFSKLQDRIVGTQGEVATIYDIATGKLVKALTPSISNQYTKNRATFSMNDELILSDGILWDVNSGKEIHKFDKLNQTLNGVFHPNGTEVVSNTEVWDLRTFDVKRGIYDLACNKFDTQIAVVENMGEFDSIQESCVRLYDVGRRRADEDEAEEDDDDEDLDASDDDGSNSGSDDNNADDADNGDAQGDDNGDGDDHGDGDNDDDNSDGEDTGDESLDFHGIFSSDEYVVSDVDDVEILFN